MKSETLRRMWALCAGALIFAAGSSARAQDAGGMACLNDIDCPEPACGGQVCDYNKGAICVPAGGAKKGMDGWCTADSDCKCLGMGAKCVSMLYCSFTLPKDAPPGGGTGGAGGSATTGAGGTTATGTAGDATTAAPPADSGGCSIASTPAAGLGSTGLLVGLGAIAFGARRRRRAA